MAAKVRVKVSIQDGQFHKMKCLQLSDEEGRQSPRDILSTSKSHIFLLSKGSKTGHDAVFAFVGEG